MTINRQIKELERLKRTNDGVYARLVGAGRMAPGEAEARQRTLSAAIKSLRTVQRHRAAIHEAVRVTLWP